MKLEEIKNEIKKRKYIANLILKEMKIHKSVRASVLFTLDEEGEVEYQIKIRGLNPQRTDLAFQINQQMYELGYSNISVTAEW